MARDNSALRLNFVTFEKPENINRQMHGHQSINMSLHLSPFQILNVCHFHFDLLLNHLSGKKNICYLAVAIFAQGVRKLKIHLTQYSQAL